MSFFPGVLHQHLTMETETPANNSLSSSDIVSNFPSEVAPEIQLRGALLMLPFFLFVVLANVLTSLAFLVEKRLRVFYNYFVFNMAIADALIGITAMGSSVVQFLFNFQWPFGYVSCSILMTISHTSFHVSILMVLVICLDRWYSVHCPLRHIRVRRRNVAMKVNASVWLIAFAFWGPFMGIWSLLDPVSQTAKACSPVYLRFPLATFGAVLMVYWIPISVITIMYVSLYRKILQSGGHQVSRNFEKQRTSVSPRTQSLSTISNANSMFSQSSSNETELNEQKEIKTHRVMTSVISDGENDGSGRNNHDKATVDEAKPGTKPKANQDEKSSIKAQRTLTLLVVVLVITWTPYSCVVAALTYCSTIKQQERCFSPFLSVISVWITWGNSLLNPIMYAAAQPLFRKTIFQILLGKKCSKSM